MDIKKETITVSETVMRTNEKVLVSSDIIVPDVKSDIAKVLRLDADAIVESCTYTGSHIEIDGKIYLTILYVPENNENQPVCSIVTDIPFETQIEDSRLTEGVKAVCKADVYNIEFNLLNSRKLCAKTLVDLNLHVIRLKQEDFVVSMDDSSFEVYDDSAKIFSLIDFKNTKFTAEEILDFPSGKPGAVSVLKTDVRLMDYQTHIITGKIIVKGSVESCCLYVGDNGKIEFVNHEIPFTEVIDASGVNENSICDLTLGVCVSSARLRADSDGDMRLLELEMLFSAEVLAYEQSEIKLISDCFSVSDNAVCKQKKINLEKLVYSECLRKDIKGSIVLGENMPPVETVYNILVKPYIEKTTVSDGQINIEGSCDCYALYLSSKENMPIFSAMSSVEFSLSVNSNQINENCICSAAAKVNSSSYNITLSGEIEIRCALDVCVSATDTYEKEFVSEIEPAQDEPKNKRHGVCVYFVKKGDSLWKIAKKYKVPLGLLIKLNKLENPDLIYPGQPVLVPMPQKACK